MSHPFFHSLRLKPSDVFRVLLCLLCAAPFSVGNAETLYYKSVTPHRPSRDAYPFSSDSASTGEWGMSDTQLSPAFARLPEIESRLYGHSYSGQGLRRRIERVEQALFGEPHREKTLEIRMQAIEQRANDDRSFSNNDPVVAYLENKLFQRTFEDRLLPDRLRQLEIHVFGHSFDTDPTDTRLKKLTYAMPLMAREVRLNNNDGQMIARASAASVARMARSKSLSSSGVALLDAAPHKTTPAPAVITSTPFDAEPVQLDVTDIPSHSFPQSSRRPASEATAALPSSGRAASDPIHSSLPTDSPVSEQLASNASDTLTNDSLSIPTAQSVANRPDTAGAQRVYGKPPHSGMTPSPLALSSLSMPSPSPTFPETGNYIEAIYRNADGTALRWKSMPVHVFIKPDVSQATLTLRAIDAWKQSFPVEAVADPNRSDIVISWDRDDWIQNAQGLPTRPVDRIDAQKKRHTVILISLYPLHNQSEGARLHALTHQLGHALGLWGHSLHPSDIMTPWLDLEKADFPQSWLGHTATAPPTEETMGRMDDFQPTLRDINTLRKIYDIPATDLKRDRLPL